MIDKNRSEHIILGVDPGTLYMGYALLHTVGQQVEIIDFGVLDVHKLDGQYPRLQQEFFFLQELIDKHHPTSLAIETQFVDKNPQTMIKIVHAQGVAIAAALSKDVPIYEYSPMKIKMAITGNGHSSKEQVAGMLQRFLYLQLGMPVSEGGPKDWTTFAKRKGLTDKGLTGPAAQLAAALATAKKKKK